MRVAIVYNRVGADSAPDERDVLDQVQAVDAALEVLGHSTIRVPCTLDLDALKRILDRERPHCVFNLVESLGGQGRLAHLAAALFEAMALPYTGSASMALLSTDHKVLAKDRMAAGGLPTPDWIGPWPAEPHTRRPASPVQDDNVVRWIVKSVWEHASFGIADDGLIDARRPESIWEFLRLRADAMGGSCFAERYVDGREFNLALLAGPNRPEVLPPAEILFEDYPASKPHIVGYRAKWDAQAFEYHHTPRRFDFPPRDRGLIEQLKAAARRCWEVFGLGGYARVDFRVDKRGRPFILEVNTNPCLSPDSGFAAALEQAELTFPQAIARILADALRFESFPSNPLTHPFTNGRTAQAERRDLKFRRKVKPADIDGIRRLVNLTGFFNTTEVDIAAELVEEQLKRGDASGYHFLLVEHSGRLAGYACYGPIPATRSSFDVYWIAVHTDEQRRGLGRRLLQETEKMIAKAGGSRIYVDTSQRMQYAGTRAFYERCGYRLESVLPDFYAPGDGKVTYCKSLT